MSTVLMIVYASGVVCFLLGYRERPSVSGVILSLLWPVPVVFTLAWLFDFDGLLSP
jgi:hypothetical protein